jgi:phospholipase/lecithinase/hemolysin
MAVKSRIQFTLAVLLSGLACISAQAAFTSLYVFGDSLSCTTNNPSAGSTYYGQRYSNGRVWVEVLAQRQGVATNAIFNNSYYGNYSSNVLKTVKTFNVQDTNTALVVVWVNNADLFDLPLYTVTDLAVWTNSINQSTNNYYQIITNLYGKGFRTLVMPNVVDLSTIPKFNHSSGTYTNTVHQQCLAYNVAFNKTIGWAKTNYPDLKIYSPDIYSLLTNLLWIPLEYGVTNVTTNWGSVVSSVDAITKLGTPALSTGPGTNYIFWDQFNPTAFVHAIIADVAQQSLSPVQFAGIAQAVSSNRLDIAFMPIGTTNNIVLYATNLDQSVWLTNSLFFGVSNVQSIYVSPTNSQRFYRLKFPWQWVWP